MPVMAAQGNEEPSIDVINEDRHYRVTDYFGDWHAESFDPQGFLVQVAPAEVKEDQSEYVCVKPHFHLVRQYQVVVGGSGIRIGKAALGPFDFHYADPSTPYGPIVADKDGIEFFTLRPRGETDAHWMPGSREEMTAPRGRNLVVRGSDGSATEPGMEALIEPHDDGLASYRWTLEANSAEEAPSAADSGGQYLLVARGTVRHDGESIEPRGLIWVGPEDPAPVVEAGDDGAEVLVLQFPRRNPDIEPAPQLAS
jgi:hypothetical protein